VLTKEQQEQVNRVHEEFRQCSDRPEQKYVNDEIMLDVGEGIKLRTIIYRPKLEGTVPTIMVRTCYPDNDPVYRATAEEYCERGYAYVYQYCRGTGGSEGDWEPNVNERHDGKVTIDWVCDQTWVESVGYCGCSYLSLTGWVIADILPNKVKTMYLTHYGAFRFISAYKDGLFRHDVLTAWSMENAGYPVKADYLESCKFRPQIKVDEKLWGKKIDWYRKWITSTDADDIYWNTGFWSQLKDIPSHVHIPLYIGEGWYDHHLASALETYKTLPQDCRDHSCLLIGAWNHGFDVCLQDRSSKGNFENSDTLRAYNWFRNILVNNRIPEGTVKYYIIGNDTWFERKTFEIVNQGESRFYLGARTSENIYSLSKKNTKENSSFSFQYDPENPVMTHGAESLLHTREEQGSLRQEQLGYRADVISCISEPTHEDMTVIGRIKVHLIVSSDVDDTAFAVKIIEVMADGNAYNMRTCITTLGYRNSSPKRIPYQPKEKVCIDFDGWDLAWKIHKGSRIRIDITSSDFPQYSIHSNYAGCWALQDKSRVALQTVYFGGTDESYISFPISSI